MKLKKIHLFFIIVLILTLLPFFKYFLGYTIESMTTQTRKINDSTFTKTYDENNNALYTASTPMGNAAVYKNKDGEITYGTSNGSNLNHRNNYYNTNNTDYNTDYNTNDTTKTITTSDGRVVLVSTDNNVNGINYNDIPKGDEDLYILKSQVVPPVCPACPTMVNNCDKNHKCPPCPPCARCPEPSFECVKRPTYQPDNPYLPMPVLADFSQFGM
jgi:hypothetical protein